MAIKKRANFPVIKEHRRRFIPSQSDIPVKYKNKQADLPQSAHKRLNM